MSILDQAKSLAERKSQDYGNTINVVSEMMDILKKYEVCPDNEAQRLLVMQILIKMARILNLTTKAKGVSNFESCKDSLIDIINYTVIFSEYL